jgi:hypothetical protein
VDLGAAIQAHVAERLRERGIVPPARLEERPPRSPHEHATGQLLLFAAFVVAVCVAGVVAVLYLIFG